MRSMVLLPLPVNSSGDGTRDEGLQGTGQAVAFPPEKVRRIVNRGLVPRAAVGNVPVLPPLDEAKAEHIVQRHAHVCLVSGKYGDPFHVRRRRRGKQKECTADCLVRLVNSPTMPVTSAAATWVEKRKASQWLARVYAQLYKQGVRASRKRVRDMWATASETVKSNAIFLRTQTEHLPLEPPPQLCADAAVIECRGCLVTWQTRWGRSSDIVGDLLARGLNVDEMVEVCRTSEALATYFDGFVSFVAAAAEKIGMKFYSCAMELNKEDAATNKVHLHAFMCINWKNWGQKPLEPLSVRRVGLTFDECIPDVRVTRVHNRANPAKLFQQGLYYQLCPKIGSVFRTCNLRLWQDDLLTASQKTWVLNILSESSRGSARDVRI